VFVGLSVGGIVTGEMLKGMAKRPIVFALANPNPEVHAGGGPPGTQRRDHRHRPVGLPNQVNNVLGFPFIFRGASRRARQEDQPRRWRMAATRALAALAKEEVPMP